MPNFNTATGIPYGTIYTHELDSDLFLTLIDAGIDLNYDDSLEEFARSHGWMDSEDW